MAKAKQEERPEAPAAETVGPILRITRREEWLPVPEYPGFKVRMWANYPERLRRDLNAEDVALVRRALLQIVREHNGWCDEEGAPFPAADTEAFWEAIPNELAALLIVLARHKVTFLLPNSVANRKGL